MDTPGGGEIARCHRQGEVVMLVNSAGHLEIAMRGARAAEQIGARRGDAVEVRSA